MIMGRGRAVDEVEDLLPEARAKTVQAIGVGDGMFEGIQHIAGQVLAAIITGDGFLNRGNEAWERLVKFRPVLVDRVEGGSFG